MFSHSVDPLSLAYLSPGTEIRQALLQVSYETSDTGLVRCETPWAITFTC